MKLVSTSIVVIATAFIAASCAQDTIYPTDLPTSSSICEAEGGTVRAAGLLGQNVCFPIYRDAGQSCSAGNQCEGFCLSETLTCAPTKQFGCFGMLDDDGDKLTICID